MVASSEEMSGKEYDRLIGTANPGLIMILVDQSGSMRDNRKMYWAAEAVNQTIQEILSSCIMGTRIKDRLFVGVIGYYGSSVTPLVGGKISEVASKSIRIDRVGPEKLELPIWVEPRAENGTPMAEAFKKASDLTGDWVAGHQDSFPPVVINITDGEPNDANEAQSKAAELMTVGTNYGKLLLYNAHITGARSSREVLLPNSTEELNDPYARLLFGMSSRIPQNLFPLAESAGLTPGPGARGMVFNAGAPTLIKLLAFGSGLSGLR